MLKIEMKDFKERYSAMKENGYFDCEIADVMNISKSTLRRLKIAHGFKMIKNPLRNSYGLTNEGLEIAKKNGLDLHTVYQRLASCDWDLEKAISEPKIPIEKRWEWRYK